MRVFVIAAGFAAALAALGQEAQATTHHTIDFTGAGMAPGAYTDSFVSGGYTISGSYMDGMAHLDGCCGPYSNSLSISRSDGGLFDLLSFEVPWYSSGYSWQYFYYDRDAGGFVFGDPALAGSPYDYAMVVVTGGAMSKVYDPAEGSSLTPGGFTGVSSLTFSIAMPDPNVQGLSFEGDTHFGLDNIQLSAAPVTPGGGPAPAPVPLPAAGLSLLAGLMGIAALRRRR